MLEPIVPSSLPGPLAALSPGQIEVLALVAQFKSSKEIARQLGISPNTVDQRLKRVQFLLGVPSRFDAARLYIAATQGADATALWGDLVYQSSGLSPAAGPVMSSPSTGLEDRTVDGAYVMQQPMAGYADGFRRWDEPRPWFSVLLEAGRQNELSSLARAAAIGGITLAAVLAMAAVVSLAEGLSRIF